MLDLTNVQENNGREPLPAGEYCAQVVKAEVKDTQAGTGEYIKLEYDLLEAPKSQGEEPKKLGKVWHQFNTKNPNAQAVEIGLGQLKSFLKVSKFADPNHLTDVNDLVGLTCNIRIKVRKSDEYGDKNEITSFKEWNATPGKGAPGVGTAAPKNPFA